MEFAEFMRFPGRFFACVCMAACAVIAAEVAAQDPAGPASKPKTPRPASEAETRITIEVSGGDKGVPVASSSVYGKDIEERCRRRDNKLAANVKPRRDGSGHAPDAPTGRVLGRAYP